MEKTESSSKSCCSSVMKSGIQPKSVDFWSPALLGRSTSSLTKASARHEQPCWSQCCYTVIHFAGQRRSWKDRGFSWAEKPRWGGKSLLVGLGLDKGKFAHIKFRRRYYQTISLHIPPFGPFYNTKFTWNRACLKNLRNIQPSIYLPPAFFRGHLLWQSEINFLHGEHFPPNYSRGNISDSADLSQVKSLV